MTVVPDPELTLSEAVNTMAELVLVIRDRNGDAVLESAWEKLRNAASVAAHEDPDAYEALFNEILMRKRFEND